MSESSMRRMKNQRKPLSTLKYNWKKEKNRLFPKKWTSRKKQGKGIFRSGDNLYMDGRKQNNKCST